MTSPHYGNDIVNSYISVNDHPTTATYICINNASIAVMKVKKRHPRVQCTRQLVYDLHIIIAFSCFGNIQEKSVPDTITCNHSHMQLSVATCYCWIA